MFIGFWLKNVGMGKCRGVAVIAWSVVVGLCPLLLDSDVARCYILACWMLRYLKQRWVSFWSTFQLTYDVFFVFASQVLHAAEGSWKTWLMEN